MCVNKDNIVTHKSFRSLIANAFGIKSWSGEESIERPVAEQEKAIPWPEISTEQIVKFFLKYSSQEERLWLQSAMSGAGQFRIVNELNRQRIEFQLDCDLLNINWWSNNVIPNDIPDYQFDRFWKNALNKESLEALAIRNRLMAAVDWGVESCSVESLKALLTVVQRRDCIEAERLKEEIFTTYNREHIAKLAARVKKREQQGPIYGRDYEKKKEGDLWSCYKTIIYNRDNHCCQHCGVKTSNDNSLACHIDHIKPISRGGTTELSNLQLLCEACNLSKGTKLEERFPPEIQAGWYKNRQGNDSAESS